MLRRNDVLGSYKYAGSMSALNILIRYRIISYRYILIKCHRIWTLFTLLRRETFGPTRGMSVSERLVQLNMNTDLIFKGNCIKYNIIDLRALNIKLEALHRIFVKFPNIYWSDSALSVLGKFFLTLQEKHILSNQEHLVSLNWRAILPLLPSPCRAQCDASFSTVRNQPSLTTGLRRANTTAATLLGRTV
jgi:hypothetical protein